MLLQLIVIVIVKSLGIIFILTPVLYYLLTFPACLVRSSLITDNV